MNESHVIAIVPMRHDSVRVPGKNFRPLGGLPLFHHVVHTLQACPSVGTVVIDTDSPTITLGAARHFPKVRVLRRPTHLRDDRVPMNDVLKNAIGQLEGEVFLQTHSTNPLITSETIETAIATFRAGAGRHDSLFGVTRLQQRLWDASCRPVNHDPAVLLRTQDLPPIYVENSCVYVFTRESFARCDNRIGRTPMMFPIDPIESTDIDTEHDFLIAEALFAARTRPAAERAA